MRMKKRKTAVFACVIVLFFCAILLGLCWGSYEISVHEVIATLLGNGTKIQNTAIFESVYRVSCLVFLWRRTCDIGRCFTDNDKEELADPGIIGINAGGATAAVLFTSFRRTHISVNLGHFLFTCFH